MGSRRSVRIAGAAVLAAAAAAAAILINLALLGYAQPRNDPVGKLSPRAVLPGATTQPARTVTIAPPVATVPGRHGEHDD